MLAVCLFLFLTSPLFITVLHQAQSMSFMQAAAQSNVTFTQISVNIKIFLSRAKFLKVCQHFVNLYFVMNFTNLIQGVKWKSCKCEKVVFLYGVLTCIYGCRDELCSQTIVFRSVPELMNWFPLQNHVCF